MRLSIGILVILLSACSLAPRLEKPLAPIPAIYDADIGDLAGGSMTGWREMFGDARLQRLIELALINNRDLRLAALNVGAVQAQFGIQRSARLPAVDLDGGVTRERITGQSSVASNTVSGVQERYTVGGAMSAFEIDLFGRVRALSDAAFARYLASEQGHRAARIALVGAVADAYFAERIAAEQLALAESTLTDWRSSLDLALRLHAARQNSALDVAQAEGQVAGAEADVEARRRTLTQSGNALRLLVGTALATDLPDPGPLNREAVIRWLPAGLPSDLLIRRPDILQAEQQLIAANADIGAARAAFLPRLSLTASLGYASPALNGLFESDQRTWTFAPQITQPLFQGGRLRAELRLSEIRKAASVAEYERAIQIAFREVADGLAGRATYGRQIDAQARNVASAERRRLLSSLRYGAGVDSRLELLDAQRQLYAAQQSLLDIRGDELRNMVALYKALGGGLEANGSERFADIP